MSAPELPDVPTWDNPFPAFPGTKKKASREVERTVVENMAAMDIRAPPPSQSMSKRADGGRGSQDRYPGRRSADDYGRPSVDSQRNIPPRGPIQGQGYPDPRRGPPGPAPRPTYDPPRQDGHANPAYDDRGAYGPPAPVDGFGPPSRSMTMPNQPPMGMQAPRQAPPPVDPSASERPYNGPIGKGMPPRPSTTTGVRPPPQRIYPNQNPAPPPVQAVKPPQLQYPPKDSYANQNNNHLAPQSSESQQRESVSDFYDSYYNSAEPQNPRHTRSQSNGSEMPNLDLIASNTVAHRRAGSMEGHRQPGIVARGNSWEQQLPNGQQNGQTNGFHGQMKPIQLQPDFSNRAQPQAAIFEMVGESPSANGYQQGYQDDRYVPQGDQYKGQQPSNQQGYGGYQAPQAQNGFQQLPRSTSAAPRSNASAGLPMGPKSGFVGLPSGPSPQQGGMAPRTTPEALPSHPPPVRAGLIPNSVVNLANNKPTPVRNYNNSGPVSTPQTSVSSTPAAESKPAGLPPVTLEELERLRTVIKNNPNDQATQLILAKRLVEASIDLVAKLPDQRQRNKARERYIMDAHKVLKKLVAVQNPEAMFYLADCHGRGALGLEADNKEAFSLYQSAAKAGHAAAAYRTAVCCELGNDEGGGTRKDPLKAIQWYKRAATLGDTPAMYKMGMIQLKGLLGQPKNPREAVGWLKRAAERADVENPHALHELGLLYEQPQGPDGSIVRDEQYSFALFKQAADLGYKFSQFRLGCAYEYGLFNCPIDPRQSIMWYSRAAVQEEHQAELALSGWYLTGSEGVLQQSDTEAYLWARKAAMAGNAKAEYAMGYFTEVGIGIPANLEDAKRWYWRAAGMSPHFPVLLTNTTLN